MSVPTRNSGGTADMLGIERKRASFDSAALQMIIAGKRPELIKKFQPLFSGAPFDGQSEDYFRSYEDMFQQKLARVAQAVRITRTEPLFMAHHMKGNVRMGDMFQSSHLGGIHFSMFLTYIKTQASKEQQKAWLDGALEARYFGAYAQTELGHGSNVRGIETTAHYDKETEEFVIHSPTLTSLKWWPTGMYACTHGVVFARLITGGKDYGFHGFMVQFRDEDGYLMPGVEVGEIGPKINGQHANIGYARFTHIRVPRFNMFSRYQQVTKDGEYVKAPRALSKFKYISMMSIRVALVDSAFVNCAKAATIAIRYSCVRKQGFKDTKASNAVAIGENVIMDYRMQQYRTFRAMGLAYMFKWNAIFVKDYIDRVQSAIMKGDEAAGDELPELHATLAGLKVWSTVWAHAAIEDCRKACGGQGFLLSSGIAEIARSFAEPVTVEGEQVILSLQVARFLLKAVGMTKRKQAVAGSVTYLTDPPLGKVHGTEFNASLIVALLKDRAARVAFRLEKHFAASVAEGLPFDDALNSVAVLAYKAAECHSAYVMMRNNLMALEDYVKDADIRVALTHVLELTGLQLIHEHIGDWMGVLSEEQDEVMLALINALCATLRPDAVALVDSFGFTDSQLESALGRYDGQVYEAIYATAKANPLNRTDRMVGWDDFKTVLDLDFLREGAKVQRSRM